MRRVRQFVVRLSTRQATQELEFESWHALCSAIAAELLCEGKTATVSDAGNGHRTIADISLHNKQLESEPASNHRNATQWRSELLAAGDAQPPWYVNCNVTDFQWELLEGARREVPFRLSFAERRAQRNPDGIWAFSLGIMEA